MAERQYLPCPHCKTGRLTAVGTAPYARGFLIAYQYGSKKIAGCKACVAKGLRAEAGKSLLFGWFSISALFLNVFMIPWNLIQSFLVKDNPTAVSKLLDEVGIPEPGTEYRLTDAFYSAAATMIRADGKIDASEVATAKRLGMQMLPDFNEAQFDKVMSGTSGMATTDAIGTVFRVYLKPEAHGLVLQYLLAIANADGVLHKNEDKYLESLCAKMDYDKQQYQQLRDAPRAAATAAA